MNFCSNFINITYLLILTTSVLVLMYEIINRDRNDIYISHNTKQYNITEYLYTNNTYYLYLDNTCTIIQSNIPVNTYIYACFTDFCNPCKEYDETIIFIVISTITFTSVLFIAYILYTYKIKKTSENLKLLNEITVHKIPEELELDNKIYTTQNITLDLPSLKIYK